MGNWGTAIKSNDTYADIYGLFFDLYNDGLEVKDITQKLIAENQETITDPDDCNNFWFALAKAQWECKQLDNELLQRVKQIIETGADLEVWRQLDAEEKDVSKRKVVLDKFLAELLSERPKAKARKKKIIRQPVFAKGDCLSFKLANGNYGGAVVLEAIYDTELGSNLIANTRLNQETEPSAKDFENAEVLVLSFANWKDKPDIIWFSYASYKRDTIELKVVSKINVELNYKTDDYSKGFYYGGSGDSLKEQADRQFQFEQSNARPQKKITIKELIRKSKWKLW
jgi:hypothetical protein